MDHCHPPDICAGHTDCGSEHHAHTHAHVHTLTLYYTSQQVKYSGRWRERDIEFVLDINEGFILRDRNNAVSFMEILVQVLSPCKCHCCNSLSSSGKSLFPTCASPQTMVTANSSSSVLSSSLPSQKYRY